MFVLQYRRGKGTFRKATSEQSEEIQFFPFRHRAVRQITAADRNRTDRVHRIHREGSGMTRENHSGLVIIIRL